MQTFDYLIIGGGIAGTTASEEIRKNDPHGSIAIVSDEPYRLYSRIMLSKPNWFLEKTPFETIWLKKENWYKENNIELLLGKKAIKLDTNKNEITLQNSNKISYKKLLLATGACARKFPMDNANTKRIFNLRTLEDGKNILKASSTCKEFVAIGGGFISFEIADLMKQKGAEVTLIIREQHFWDKILDNTASNIIENAMKNSGIKFIKNMEIKKIIGENTVEGVLLNNGQTIACDMIVYGIGVLCENIWIQQAGIEVNQGILTDEYLQTNKENIWAIGDVCEFKDLALNQTSRCPNWINAQKQGQIAGRNMTGAKEAFKFVSYYTSKGFGITVAFIGDIRPSNETTILSRTPTDKNSSARIIIKNKKIIGASLINRNQELILFQKIISKNIDISQKHKELEDPNFDLNTLLHD